MWISGIRWYRRWWRLRACRRGVASIEFAFVVPIMLLVFLGSIELGDALLLDRKVSRSVHIGGDLVAQLTAITDPELADVFSAMEQIIAPFPNSTRMVISSVVTDPGSTSPRLAWSVARGGGPAVSAGDTDIPAGLLEEDQSVIVVQIEYSFSPVYSDLIMSPFMIIDQVYLRPRKSKRVQKL